MSIQQVFQSRHKLEIFTYREEAGLEQTQNNTTRGQSSPVVGETHSNHYSAPRNTQACEEDARADLAGENGGRRLENDVCDEEDKGDDGLRCGMVSSKSMIDVVFNGLGPLTYLISMPKLSSMLIPAIAALDKLVRSMRETQYMTPTTTTNRLSSLWMIFFCSSGVK